MRLTILAAPALLFLAGCAASDLTVQRAAEPNPFVGVTRFVIQPIEYRDLVVDGKPEADFLADRDDAISLWQEDKADVDALFRELTIQVGAKEGLEIVNADSGSAPFVVRPIVGEIETGYYRIPAWNAVTRIFMTVEIGADDGTVHDVIEVVDGVSFDAMINPTTGGRMRSVAKALGRMVADYLAERSEG